jgi:uncharacterized protein (DUF2147 family)
VNLKAAWLVGVLLVLLPARLRADPTPPPVVGLWQVYDDKTGQPNGVVRLYMQNGELNGVVARLRAGVPPDATCLKCSPPQKNKPVLGLVILWGLKPDGDAWSGGSVLDPDSGDTYRCTVHLSAPDKLDVRGYIGISIFGRTQTWVRTP